MPRAKQDENATSIRMRIGGGMCRLRATPSAKTFPRRTGPLLGVADDCGRTGTEWRSRLLKDARFAGPPHHRSSDEAVHEVPTYRAANDAGARAATARMSIAAAVHEALPAAAQVLSKMRSVLSDMAP
jgi:hypothetical protein